MEKFGVNGDVRREDITVMASKMVGGAVVPAARLAGWQVAWGSLQAGPAYSRCLQCRSVYVCLLRLLAQHSSAQHSAALVSRNRPPQAGRPHGADLCLLPRGGQGGWRAGQAPAACQ